MEVTIYNNDNNIIKVNHKLLYIFALRISIFVFYVIKKHLMNFSLKITMKMV